MRYALPLLASALLFSTSAFARHLGGGGQATSGLKDGSSLTGLCSGDPQNTGGRWRNWCKDIDDELMAPAPNCKVGNGREVSAGKGSDGSFCDVLREEILADGNEKNNYLGFGEACPPDKLKEILNDQTKFELFTKQLMAVLTIQESECNPHSTSNMGAKGLMQLDRKSVSGYGQCCGACKTLGHTGNISSDNDDNMKCGTAIAMYWMVSDKTMGNGSGNKGSKGIARYFQPFRRIDRANRRWMMAKTKNYCENRIDLDSNDTTVGGSTTGH